MDDAAFHLIMLIRSFSDGRPGSTSKSNLKNFKKKYQSQFPQKTEQFITPDNFNNLYCHQKFKRINDESFSLI